MTNEHGIEARKFIDRVGAYRADGHFAYSSGRHGPTYIDQRMIFIDVHATSRLCQMLAERLMTQGADAVFASTDGGAQLTQWTAFHLSSVSNPYRKVFAGWVERTFDGGLEIQDTYLRLVRGKRILVVEDVLNTGKTVSEVVRKLRAEGGTVVGVGALVNRGGATAESVGDVPLFAALADMPDPSWDAAECPLCAQGIPLERVARR